MAKATVTDEPVDYKKAIPAKERQRFQGLAQRKIAADAKKKEAEVELEAVKEELMINLLTYGDRLALWDGMVLKIGRGATASRVDPKKLLELGVPVKTIDKATIPGGPTEFPQVVVPKEAK